MGLRSNPSQRQRRLGEELRQLREISGLSATEAGAHASLGRAHMSHIETGRTAIPEDKLRTLARVYGCTSESYVDALVAMSQANGRGWWSEYRHPPHSQSARDLAELEASAVAHLSFQWIHVPGLLQTTDYMRVLFQGGQPDEDAETIDRYVDFRRRRQEILTGESPPILHAVIHEAALHMGFVGADVMRRQIEHLVNMARLPHVRIQILPFKASVYPARVSTPFSLLKSTVPLLNTVCVDHPTSSLFITTRPQIAQFTKAFEALRTVSLPPIDHRIEPEFHTKKDSLALIQHVLYTL
ncbi:helix-turn-helix transcriptional regulator [Streptomyces sp. MST-110588]|uniref:helix-turn-helix domain-containing protein n=1 Tax=Streptomyces sp. MST-110588 TaxID=2833628 RepID=UPI001F5D0BC3|nr:helix-turn-helix transcriptional regulator [Streptomyces sp. MST-110588]UNO40556.1 helix-turn-helix domain-containing protein [Streptomyces sp. MST-110588]